MLSKLTRMATFVNPADPYFQLSAFLFFFTPFLWNVIGRLEYRWQAVSRMAGGDRALACRLVGILIWTVGLARDAAFEMAIRSAPISPDMQANWLLRASGALLAAFGAVLVGSSLYRLGFRGTYLGDHFGFLFPAPLHGFPFLPEWGIEHPMYQGASMLFLGTALVQASPTGLFLAAWAATGYSLAGMAEGPYTAMIYKEASSAGKKRFPAAAAKKMAGKQN